MEMWCPDDIGRDSWDWVGPPAWVRACFNSPEWGGGSSPVKTEPHQIVLLLLLLLVCAVAVVALVVACLRRGHSDKVFMSTSSEKISGITLEAVAQHLGRRQWDSTSNRTGSENAAFSYVPPAVMPPYAISVVGLRLNSLLLHKATSSRK